MSNNIVQLTDYNDNNIYPIAGAAAEGSITKTMLDEGVFVGAELSDPGNIAYVGTADIQDDAVTTAKIADLNVTTAKLATGAVTSDKVDYTTIKASRVDTADFIESLPSGVSVEYSAVYKFSNIVFGSIIFKLASGTFGNAQTLMGYVKPSCRPMTTFNAYCSLSNDVWSSTNMGYAYIANNGTVYIAGHGTTGLNVAKVQFMWATN